MTKKTVTLILIFTIFFSVIAMAVWGKVPETSADIYVTHLVFYGSDGAEITEINTSVNQEKKVNLKRSDVGELTYVFQVAVMPSNATDLRLEYAIESGNVEVEAIDYRPLTPDAPPAEEAPKNIYTYQVLFLEQDLATLSFVSNFSGTRRVKDYLMFVFDGPKHSDVISL